LRLLLDTHALLWWLADDPALSAGARAAIAEPANLVFVSAASAWEIATKNRIGKLPGAGLFSDRLGEIVAQEGFLELPISFAHADKAGSLPGAHRDPFDRMLIAQSVISGLTLVSNERLFDAFGAARLW
jgi:PIN domain nuclease of toxin-antitoxin system